MCAAASVAAPSSGIITPSIGVGGDGGGGAGGGEGARDDIGGGGEGSGGVKTVFSFDGATEFVETSSSKSARGKKHQGLDDRRWSRSRTS